MKIQKYFIRGTAINKIQFSEIEDYLDEKGIDINDAFNKLVGDNPDECVYVSNGFVKGLTQENDPGEWHHFFKKENGDFIAGKFQFKKLKENQMNKESLREIVKLVESTISKKLTERIVHGEEEIWELNEPIKLFVEKYKGKPVDIFFTNDGKASVTKRTQNLVMHGKDSGRSLNLNNVKHVYSGLDNKFYRPEDIGKIFKSAYMGSNSRVRAINPNESTKITESAVPPFKSKREAILAIDDVINKEMTQKNFINQLASAKRAGTIDQNNFKLILGQLRMDTKSAGVKLEPIIDRLIDKYHSGSDVFNPNLGESVDGGWTNTFVYRKIDKKKFKVIDFKNYGSYQELFLKSNDGETDEVTLGHPMQKNGFLQTYTVNESRKLTENPLAPVATSSIKPAAPAPTPTPVTPVEQGVDPAWKLDMVEFLGNSFQGQAKQFLYQAKKSNPKATPEQITAMVNDLIQSNQIVELFKTRFLSSIKAAL